MPEPEPSSERRPVVRLSDLRGNSSTGLECKACGCRHFRVVQTRPKQGYIYRQRECRHCGTKATTTERVVG